MSAYSVQLHYILAIISFDNVEEKPAKQCSPYNWKNRAKNNFNMARIGILKQERSKN